MSSCFPGVRPPEDLSLFTSIMSLVLCLVVTIGNSLVLLAVLVDPLKKLRTPFSYFLVNLTISDLISGVITLPLAFVVHNNERRGKTNIEEQFKAFHVSFYLSATVSVLSLGALSLDRFVAIRWPIHYRTSLSLKRCFCISVLIWVLSICISLVYLKTGLIEYLMVFVHIAVATTFVLMVVTYRQVYQTLRNRAKQLRAMQMSEEFTSVKNEKKVTRAYLFILALFICSYVPAIIMIYVLQFCEHCSCEFRHVLRDLQFLLIASNSAMNPFVCTIRLGPFRRSIIALFCRRKKKETTKTPKDIALDDNTGKEQAQQVTAVASLSTTE